MSLADDVKRIANHVQSIDDRLRKEQIANAATLARHEEKIEENENKITAAFRKIDKHIESHWGFYAGTIAIVGGLLTFARAYNSTP